MCKFHPVLQVQSFDFQEFWAILNFSIILQVIVFLILYAFMYWRQESGNIFWSCFSGIKVDIFLDWSRFTLKTKFSLTLGESRHTSEDTWNIFILLPINDSKIAIGALDKLI